jgi:hypothetical protein
MAIITGCSVTNSKVSGYIAGGIVGYKATATLGGLTEFTVGCGGETCQLSHEGTCGCSVLNTEISAYLYAGGVLGQHEEGANSYTIKGALNQLSNITFGALYNDFDDNTFAVSLASGSKTYMVNAKRTTGRIRVQASYYTNYELNPELTSVVYESKDIETVYSIATGDSFYSFVPNGNYGYVCGSDRNFNQFLGTYDSKLFNKVSYFEFNDLIADGYVLSTDTKPGVTIPGVDKISVYDSTLSETINLSESGTIYNTRTQADSAISSVLNSYSPTVVNMISQEYISDIINGTNNSGYNPENKRYTYVYRIPNTNIYVKSFVDYPAADLDSTPSADVYDAVINYAPYLLDSSTATGRTSRGDVVYNALYTKRANSNFSYQLYVNAYSNDLSKFSQTGANTITKYCYDPDSGKIYDYRYTVGQGVRFYYDYDSATVAERDITAPNAQTGASQTIRAGETMYSGGTMYWYLPDVVNAINSATTGSPIQWHTDCCGFIRLVYAMSGKYADCYPGGTKFNTSDNPGVVMKPGDVIYKSSSPAHILMFTYAEVIDGTTYYHFIDQSHLDRIGEWNATKGCITNIRSGTSPSDSIADSREYYYYHSYL